MQEMDEGLQLDYDSSFDGEEKSLHMLKLTSDKFTRSFGTISIRSVGLSEPIKKGRLDTKTGLTKSIKELGVVNPIHVMTTESGEGDDDDFKYMLLSGLRRLYGAMRNGIEDVDAVIWDFEDKDLGRQVALPLSLILDRGQRRSWGEIWDLYRILELQSSISPGTLEYFLQLEAGDAMKLKDVMYCDYEEVISMLKSEEKTLDQCYKMLQKLRKEEDQLAKDDLTGISDTIEGVDELVSDEERGRLSEDDVLELLEMADSVDDTLDNESFDDLNKSEDVTIQDVNDRQPVDPLIRQGTFRRDDYKCRCCGTGDVAFLGTLRYHHVIPVHSGGADNIENGLTVCDSCHQTIHIAEKNGGKLQMTREQFESYDNVQQQRIKKILRYAKIAVEASRRKGISRDRVRAEANKSLRSKMPGEGLKETLSGYNASKSLAR